MIEGGMVQLLDPFTLQAFQAFRIQSHSAICVNLIDKYKLYGNSVWGYGRRLMFNVELDYEIKGKKSVFSQ